MRRAAALVQRRLVVLEQLARRRLVVVCVCVRVDVVGGGVEELLGVLVLAVVLLDVLELLRLLRRRRRGNEHGAVDEGGYAADHEGGPRHADDDGPGSAEAVEEAALEHVAELDGEQRKGAVWEDDGPVVDPEPGDLPEAAGDRKGGHHDPGDAHAPEDVGRGEAEGIHELARDGGLREVGAAPVGDESGEVRAVDEQGEPALAEGCEGVEGAEDGHGIRSAVEEDAEEQAEGDHGGEAQADETHGESEACGDECEIREFGGEAACEETTACGGGDEGYDGDDPDGHEFG